MQNDNTQFTTICCSTLSDTITKRFLFYFFTLRLRYFNYLAWIKLTVLVLLFQVSLNYFNADESEIQLNDHCVFFVPTKTECKFNILNIFYSDIIRWWSSTMLYECVCTCIFFVSFIISFKRWYTIYT